MLTVFLGGGRGNLQKFGWQRGIFGRYAAFKACTKYTLLHFVGSINIQLCSGGRLLFNFAPRGGGGTWEFPGSPGLKKRKKERKKKEACLEGL
jgi:hypothetical protein